MLIGNKLNSVKFPEQRFFCLQQTHMEKLKVFSGWGYEKKLQKAIQDHQQSTQTRSRVQKAHSISFVINLCMATERARTNTSRWQWKSCTTGDIRIQDTTSNSPLLNKSSVTRVTLSILRRPSFQSSWTSPKRSKPHYTVSCSDLLFITTLLIDQDSQWPGVLTD